MSVKHTPGPWKADKNSGCRTIWGRKIGKHAQAQYITPICSTPGLIDDGEDAANARLIAAAPELLDAVKRLTIDPRVFDCLPDQVLRARAAIAKAEGK